MSGDTMSAIADDQLRDEVRSWLAANWRHKVRDLQEFGTTAEYRAWMGRVLEARWAVPRWPAEWYGRGLSDDQARIIEREFATAGAPGTGLDRTHLYANTALAFGTPEMKRKLIPGMLRGEIAMCLLYSEPAAGSDLAAVRTRAERQG
jgi:alkylation response protein AidB-like acyl-CoA dehydrogenase